jgi:hypothetical protein
LSNSAECYLKLNDAFRAEKTASRAIAIDGNHIKSLFRRATARLTLAQEKDASNEALLQAALTDIQVVLDDNTSNRSVSLQLLNKIKRQMQLSATGKDVFSGPHVFLIKHLDAPCFGGKDALWKLHEAVYVQAVMGNTRAQSELRDLADAGDTSLDAHAQYLWGKLLSTGAGVRGSRIVPESDAEAQHYWLKAAAHGHAFATDGLGVTAQNSARWADAITY